MDLSYKHTHFHWHLEVSKKCMLKCPRCPRTECRGMYDITEMTLEFVKKIFDQERLSKVKRLILCGGEGDPIYCSQFLEIVEYIKPQNPEIVLVIITNGSYKPKEWWQKLGGLLNGYDAIVFSLDGWDQESNQIYRVNSNWESILVGINALQDTKAFLNWSTIVFKFNQDKIPFIREEAKRLGFDSHTFVQSNLFGSRLSQYIDPEIGEDPLEPSQESWSQQARHLKNTVRLTDKVRLRNDFKKLCEEADTEIESLTHGWSAKPLCRTGDRSIYVTADGFLSPCSWVTHPYKGAKKSKVRPELERSWEETFFIKNRKQFSLHERSVSEVLSDPIWQKLSQCWKTGDGMPLICEQKCGK